MNKWFAFAGGLVIVAVLVGFSVFRRDTDEAIKRQHQEQLKSELQALNDFKGWSKAQQDAPDPSIARLFLSKRIIDALLGSFAGMDVPVPNAVGTKLTIKEMKTDFRPGFAGLAIAASVEKSGVKADVATLARIEPQLESGVLKLRVHVDSLIPEVSWRFFDFTLSGLVKDMVQARMSDEINKADALGSISIPVTQSGAINTPAGQVQFKVTGVQGTVSFPAYSASGKVTLSRILAMPEGLYVYANVQKEG